ncbi:MAG: hypothetical protein Q8L52_00315 [bacterium]|nr:hypothetical protein [bacterium]
MKDNLKVLLQSLRTERETLEKQQTGLMHQHDIMLDRHRSEARQCVRQLLPDLGSGTIDSLRRDVPDFEVPTISAWFGFSKKLDPNVSLDTLRMQLGTYLDNSSDAPRAWVEKVGRLDRAIRGSQENLIPENSAHLADVNAKIAALEKFSAVDHSKMNPKMRQQMEQAMAAQAKANRRGTSNQPMRQATRMAPIYPTQSQASSDSGPSLLEMWLWYQLLTPHSEYSHEVQPAFVGGGGEVGGGGASGGWGETREAPQEVSSRAVVSESIEPQYALGAASFS